MGLGQRLLYAFQCFLAVLMRGKLSDDLLRALGAAPASIPLPTERVSTPEPEPAPEVTPPLSDPGDRAVQLLALLQRDGRLIDFFGEEIAPYSDAQVGAAARNVHESCRQVLERYVTLEPIIDSEEGQPVTVPPEMDPATTKLIGNVTGTPPFQGVLRHRGWQATQVQLPPLAEGAGRAVVAPAEVEIP
ncbi:MAG: DUF2760 domain-containing protein, partial [Candidatus Tectomicrobia bacterium]|nr:DUF2760 domain-containing protein [Candidatus Tectomicrobia bacterium]